MARKIQTMKQHQRFPLWALAAAILLLSACSPHDPEPPPETPSETTVSPTTVSAQAEGAYCAAHGDPKELCFICDASLRDEGRLWCREHNRYEDRCFECHPELRDESRLWCEEHSLYEDECFLCHPELLVEDSVLPEEAEVSSDGGDEFGLSDLMCEEHGILERECGICHPELLEYCPPYQGMKVRLSSAISAAKAGVVVGHPTPREMTDSVDCFAELEFDQNHLANITSLSRGIVKSVAVDLGSRVERGDLMATLTSATIGEAQGVYLQALAEHELRTEELARERDLLAQRIASERQFQVVETAHRASAVAVKQARQRLLVLGFDDGQIETLASQRSTPGLLELRAPFPGEVIERTAVQGAVVEVAEPLFTLVDTSGLWAMVNIPESEISRVSLGQPVSLTVDSLPDYEVTGELTWLSPRVDERTRLVRGRVEVQNTDRRLKAHMFARARIVTDLAVEAVVVPSSAVQNVSGTPVVFIRSSEDLFEARPVTLGIEQGGRVEVSVGLTLQDDVVMSGGFALKSQLLASRLGAGCVDE